MHADIVIDNVLEAHCYVFDKYKLIHSRINNNLFAGSLAAVSQLCTKLGRFLQLQPTKAYEAKMSCN